MDVVALIAALVAFYVSFQVLKFLGSKLFDLVSFFIALGVAAYVYLNWSTLAALLALP